MSKTKLSDYAAYAGTYFNFYRQKIIDNGKVLAFNNVEYNDIETLKNDTLKQLNEEYQEGTLIKDMTLDEFIKRVVFY